MAVLDRLALAGEKKRGFINVVLLVVSYLFLLQRYPDGCVSAWSVA